MRSLVKGRNGGAAVLAVTLLAMAVAGGCSDEAPPENPKTTGSHVWRGQTDMLFEAKEQARDVDGQLRSKELAIDRARRGE